MEKRPWLNRLGVLALHINTLLFLLGSGFLLASITDMGPPLTLKDGLYSYHTSEATIWLILNVLARGE